MRAEGWYSEFTEPKSTVKSSWRKRARVDTRGGGVRKRETRTKTRKEGRKEGEREEGSKGMGVESRGKGVRRGGRMGRSRMERGLGREERGVAGENHHNHTEYTGLQTLSGDLFVWRQSTSI